MKFLFLIILIFLSLYSCDKIPRDCEHNKCIDPCYADNDCIES
jgi:hypothetical protein